MKKLDYIFLTVVICSVFCGFQTTFAGHYAASTELIEVMFEWDYQVRLRDNILVDTQRDNSPVLQEFLSKLSQYSWQRISDVSELEIDDMHARGEKNAAEPLYNLNNIYRLKVTDVTDIFAFAARLEAQPEVLRAAPVPLPMALPTPGNFQSNQGYLNTASGAPAGIDANYAWTQTGGTGTGVTVCDLEYDWNYNHQDISKAAGSQIGSSCTTSGLPAGSQDHGTAVIGELVADNDGIGITGICHGASLLTCCTITGVAPGSWNPASAIILAISNLNAGDVILLEQQWDYSSSTATDDFIPIEWWLSQDGASQGNNAVYSAIQTAVSNGIHVVEAAGNGYYDLDTLSWHGDSGAIIVGAGGAYTGGTYPYDAGDLERLAFSSYGSRVNLQGWGESVMTTGYGTYWLEPNYNYTNNFTGTSSASPMVAGAVACCVGYWTQGLGFSAAALTPATLRTLLVSTGTPQSFPPMGYTGNIGPRPDLSSAFTALAASVPTPTPTPTPVPTTIPGEYGDAPDESSLPPGTWDAYPGIPGMQPARFPSRYFTSYGNDPQGTLFAFIGAPLCLSQIGMLPSAEADAYDPADPDGIPNINPITLTADQDLFDDGVVFNVTPPESVDIYLQGGTGFFYLLADLNQDGDWNDPGELLLEHPAALVGMMETVPIPGGFQGTIGEIWVRAVISDVPIWSFVSTMAPFWDGSMLLPGGQGEVEDYFLYIPPTVPTATPTNTAVPTATPTVTIPTSTPTSPAVIPTTSRQGLGLILVLLSILIVFASRRR